MIPRDFFERQGGALTKHKETIWVSMNTKGLLLSLLYIFTGKDTELLLEALREVLGSVETYSICEFADADVGLLTQDVGGCVETYILNESLNVHTSYFPQLGEK